jgi:uncharacterized protein
MIRFKKVNLPFPLICGVISDTHSYNFNKDWEKPVMESFKECKYLLHLGDVTHPAVLNDLESLGFKVIGVQGNNDRMLNLPHVIILTCGKYTLGMVHGGGGGYSNIIQRSLRLIKSVYSDHLDAIIFGHLHLPKDEMENGIRFLNPGSLGFPRYDPIENIENPPTFARLEINENGINFNFFSL